ncbi:MAG: restriction endonuclease subunit S [bacterium]
MTFCDYFNSNYLYQFLFANRHIFAQNAVGSTVKSLRLPIIQKVYVNIPPLSEQKKIAEILSAVDEEIEKVDKIILKTEKLLMRGLFTGRVSLSFRTSPRNEGEVRNRLN